MKKSLIYFLAVIVIFCGGCAFFKKKSPGLPQPIVYLDSSQIFQHKALQRGGNLLIEPFFAGEDVSASDELDRLALKLIQGINGVVEQGPKKFKIIGADNKDSADLVLKGYFSRLESPKGMKKLLFHQGQWVLAVEGEIDDAKTGDQVAKFSHKLTAPQRKGRFEDMAFDIGEDVGKFLASVTPEANQ